MTTRRLTLGFALYLAGTMGCGSRAASQAVPPPQSASTPQTATSNDCAIGQGGQPEQSEPVATVALGERIDPANAPRPSNESERLLFRQLYETLVRVDCNGRVEPGLATAWKIAADGRAWTVMLRENARFSDGTAVTAADVVAAWTAGGAGNVLRPEVRRLVRSASAIDDRTLEITLPGLQGELPLALAHRDLAIARRVTGSVWPQGTRTASVVTDVAKQGSPAVSQIHVSVNASSSLRFLVAPGRDARDFLDEGVDLLVTRDSRVLEYAAALPQFVAAPMAWQRTHVLLTPGRSRTAPSLSIEAREALAHDAVRGEARGAEGPFWWQTLPNCEVALSPPPGPPQSTTGRIVYDGNDVIARDLAERLVGLATASNPGSTAILDALLPDRPRRTYQRAIGLTGEALALARRGGSDAGYIVAIDRLPLDPCREIQVVAESMAWVDPPTIVPLVDTRLQAIVRRGRAGLIRERDGGLLLLEALK